MLKHQAFVDLSFPAHLPDSARSIWQATISAMALARTLGEETLPAIERYCLLYARWRQAEARLAEGIVNKAPKTAVPMVSPWLAISRATAAQLGKLESELGIAPLRRGSASRAKRPLLPNGKPAPRTVLDELFESQEIEGA